MTGWATSFDTSVTALEQRLMILERACAPKSSASSEPLSRQVEHVLDRSSSLLGSIPSKCNFARAIANEEAEASAAPQLGIAEKAGIIGARVEELKQTLCIIERIPKDIDGRAVIPSVSPVAVDTALANEIAQLAAEFDHLAARSVRLTAELLQSQIRIAEESIRCNKAK